MGRKPKEWQREPGWWSENFFAIQLEGARRTLDAQRREVRR